MNDKEKLEMLKQTYEEPHMIEGQVEIMKQSIEKAKGENAGDAKRRSSWTKVAAAAAAIVLFTALPNTSATIADAMEQIPVLGKIVEVITFRDYQYDDEKHHADIQSPEIIAGTEDSEDQLHQSASEINAEIKELADSFIDDFEISLEDEYGYQDIGFNYEVINTAENYFTLKVNCYMVSGTATQWNYYYTIDLATGERLHLSRLFKDGADYITPISENIKKQMAEQMAADDAATYWLDSDVEEWNFKAITDKTEFYINEAGNIVISFNEGDVAPMYMGIVTFEIPEEVTADIIK